MAYAVLLQYVGEVIGHTEYAHAIEKLEEYALDSDLDFLLIRRLEEEELYSLVEVWPKREDYFTYVEELSEDVRAEIDRTFQKGVRVFEINDPDDGAKMAEQIMNIVDNILETAGDSRCLRGYCRCGGCAGRPVRTGTVLWIWMEMEGIWRQQGTGIFWRGFSGK